jgi:HK97 gp10 family phage protein
MANNVAVNITGLDELQDKLNRLPVEFSRKAIRGSLRPGALVMQHAIETLARNGKYATGWLASQVYTRVKTNDLDEGSARVTFTRKQNPARIGKEKHVPGAIQEALWGEFGTKNQAPHPLVRAAFDSSKGQALDTFLAKLEENLNDTFR